jgi:hypothetical protein
MNVKFQTGRIVTHRYFEKLLCPSFPPRIKYGVNSSPAFGGIERAGFPRVKHGAGLIKSGMTNKVKGLLTHHTI